jgi:hypothetical protein
MLRDYARNTNQHLTDVARDFVTGSGAEFPRRHDASRTASSPTNRSCNPGGIATTSECSVPGREPSPIRC